MYDLEKYNKISMDSYDDIFNISKETLISRLEEDYDKVEGKYSLNDISVIMDKIYSWLGLEVNNESSAFVLAETDRLLCEALAGAGKTTISQLRIIKEKIFNKIKGHDILCLAYNDHAVKDMIQTHENMMDIINSKLGKSAVDREIVCRTFHSNVYAWVSDFTHELGIKDFKNAQMSETDEMEGMQRGLNSVVKSKQVKGVHKGTVSSLIRFNNYVRETMITSEEYKNTPIFHEIGLAEEIIDEVFEKYKLYKNFKGKIDFTDALEKFYNLLKEDLVIRKRVQESYSVVVVDEYQDLTNLMTEILKLMVGDSKTKLTCIGDGDQSIYGFRGTNSLNCLKFKEDFPTGKVLTMTINRRCRENILDIGRSIITENKYRYNKKIRSIKDGGEVIHRQYSSQEIQYKSIIKELEKMPVEKYNNICIAYRNKESSFLLTTLMLEYNIPFRIGSGFEPFNDILSKTFNDIVYLLHKPKHAYYQESVLYKILPGITRAEVKEVIKSSEDGTNFWSLDFNKYNKNIKFVSSLEFLRKCSLDAKDNKPMNQYIPQIWNVLQLYYWNFQKQQRFFPQDLEDNVYDRFNSTKTYTEFLEEVQLMERRLEMFNKSGIGVYLTTMHGLKGLEFDDIFIVDLDDDIFPAINMLDKYKYSEDVKTILTEEANRLMYVAVTRPKERLYLYWSKDNPSMYKSMIENKSNLASQHSDLIIGKLSKEIIKEEEVVVDLFDEEELDLELDLTEDDEELELNLTEVDEELELDIEEDEELDLVLNEKTNKISLTLNEIEDIGEDVNIFKDTEDDMLLLPTKSVFSKKSKLDNILKGMNKLKG